MFGSLADVEGFRGPCDEALFWLDKYSAILLCFQTNLHIVESARCQESNINVIVGGILFP